MVRRQSLEDHIPGFAASEDHRLFMMGLQRHLWEEPKVYPIEGVTFAAGKHEDPSSDFGTGNVRSLRRL
jgi:hypothetical protein